MIFDDDEDILSICTFIFEDEGWEVKTHPDCVNVVERAASFAPDVILMDNWIPDEGGIIATRQLKANPMVKTIPVIYFSANKIFKVLSNNQCNALNGAS